MCCMRVPGWYQSAVVFIEEEELVETESMKEHSAPINISGR
jgi:hypothetical protein